jgi:hypothetical protein
VSGQVGIAPPVLACDTTRAERGAVSGSIRYPVFAPSLAASSAAGTLRFRRFPRSDMMNRRSWFTAVSARSMPMRRIMDLDVRAWQLLGRLGCQGLHR